MDRHNHDDQDPATSGATNTGSRIKPLLERFREAGVAEGTGRAIHQRGEGPECFLLGRRLYCTEEAWNAWIDRLAAKPYVVKRGGSGARKGDDATTRGSASAA